MTSHALFGSPRGSDDPGARGGHRGVRPTTLPEGRHLPGAHQRGVQLPVPPQDHGPPVREGVAAALRDALLQRLVLPGGQEDQGLQQSAGEILQFEYFRKVNGLETQERLSVHSARIDVYLFIVPLLCMFLDLNPSSEFE